MAQIRTGARVVLVDVRSRIFLFAVDPGDGKILWIMPGGGSNPGETPEDTARRELAEEVGLTAAALSRCVWEREAVSMWHGRAIRSVERFYVARVSAHQVNMNGMGSDEARDVHRYRWWTLPEIVASPERFSPRALGTLLPPVLAGDLPAEPIPIGL